MCDFAGNRSGDTFMSRESIGLKLQHPRSLRSSRSEEDERGMARVINSYQTQTLLGL